VSSSSDPSIETGWAKFVSNTVGFVKRKVSEMFDSDDEGGEAISKFSSSDINNNGIFDSDDDGGGDDDDDDDGDDDDGDNDDGDGDDDDGDGDDDDGDDDDGDDDDGDDDGDGDDDDGDDDDGDGDDNSGDNRTVLCDVPKRLFKREDVWHDGTCFLQVMSKESGLPMDTIIKNFQNLRRSKHASKEARKWSRRFGKAIEQYKEKKSRRPQPKDVKLPYSSYVDSHSRK
jgi:hypothetical protein